MTENRFIEFKSGFNEEEAMETLAAFANSKGGKVIIGVNDKGIPVKNFVIGVESIQRWLNEFKTKTQPSTLQSDIVSQVEDIMSFIRKHINKEIIISDCFAVTAFALDYKDNQDDTMDAIEKDSEKDPEKNTGKDLSESQKKKIKIYS